VRRILFLPIISALLIFSLVGCVANQEPPVVLSKKSAVKLRAMQSRTFETPDERKVFRAILAVMLDLGYAVTSLEPKAGTITGNKLAQLNLTASISASDEKTTTVRANAVVKVNPQKLTPPHQVDLPEFYQKRFFEPLSQALFLDAMYETAPKSLQK
jgi:hypothetical protein